MIEKLFAKEAVLLAVITAFAYLYAFIFEYGYIEHFNIPVRLATISTQSIMFSGAVALVALVSWGPFANGIFDLVSGLKIRPFLLLFSYLVPAAVYIFFAFFANISNWLRLWLIFCAVLLALQFIVRPIFERAEVGSYWRAITVRLEASHTANTWPPRLRRLFGPEYYGIAMFFLFLVPALAFALGLWVASFQDNFAAIQRDGTWLFITGSSDEMIFSGFDPESNSLNGRMLILKGKELESLSLQNLVLSDPPKRFMPKIGD